MAQILCLFTCWLNNNITPKSQCSPHILCIDWNNDGEIGGVAVGYCGCGGVLKTTHTHTHKYFDSFIQRQPESIHIIPTLSKWIAFNEQFLFIQLICNLIEKSNCVLCDERYVCYVNEKLCFETSKCEVICDEKCIYKMVSISTQWGVDFNVVWCRIWYDTSINVIFNHHHQHHPLMVCNQRQCACRIHPLAHSFPVCEKKEIEMTWAGRNKSRWISQSNEFLKPTYSTHSLKWLWSL